MRRTRRRGWILSPLIGFLTVLGFSIVTALPAAAHVDLTSSTPAEGTEVEGPLDEIELRFTEAVRLAGDGLVLLNEDNTEIRSAVTQIDDTTMAVFPDEPLAGGSYAVTWNVQAGDAHPQQGLVTFAVAPMTTGPIGEDGTAGPSGLPAEPEASGVSEAGEHQDTSPAKAFASLEVSSSTFGADWLGRLARWAGMLGTLVGIGALVFGAAVPLRTAGEARTVGFWVRRAGLLILIAAPFEVVAQSALLQSGSLLQGLGIEALASALSGSFGWAVLFRLAAGAGLLWGTQLVSSASQPDATPKRVPVRPASGGATGTLVEPARRSDHRLDVRWSPLALAGSLGLLVAYLFDGHTVTAAPALLVRLADMVHVAAAATWVGGVAMLAAILQRRRSHRQPLDAGLLALRFSAIASVAITAVALAGLILTLSILESFGELFSTGWGRVLIAKLFAVGAAAALGAYNHFTVVPRLVAAEHDAASSDLLRRTVRTEATILIGVAALTAILVGAAS